MSQPQQQLPSAEALIRQHSTARVLNASQKQILAGADQFSGALRWTRPMTDRDVIEAQVSQYGGSDVKTNWPGQTDAQRQVRLDAAQAKRERRSVKLRVRAFQSFANNYAHFSTQDRASGDQSRFNPFV